MSAFAAAFPNWYTSIRRIANGAIARIATGSSIASFLLIASVAARHSPGMERGKTLSTAHVLAACSDCGVDFLPQVEQVLLIAGVLRKSEGL